MNVCCTLTCGRSLGPLIWEVLLIARPSWCEEPPGEGLKQWTIVQHGLAAPVDQKKGGTESPGYARSMREINGESRVTRLDIAIAVKKQSGSDAS